MCSYYGGMFDLIPSEDLVLTAIVLALVAVGVSGASRVAGVVVGIVAGLVGAAGWAPHDWPTYVAGAGFGALFGLLPATTKSC